MYTYQVKCFRGETTLELPDWFSWLCTEPLVFVTPFRSFGAGFGEIDGLTLKITVNLAGTYNVLVWASRADKGAVSELREFGVEYEPPAQNPPDV